MRKIESQMNRAIRTQSNWSGSNTTVFTSDNGLHSKVFLHGNHIATYFHAERQLQIFDGGWQSNTTKSRLNALCDEFCVAPGANINPEGVSMFEPIGGTAPDFTGKNQINPMAAKIS